MGVDKDVVVESAGTGRITQTLHDHLNNSFSSIRTLRLVLVQTLKWEGDTTCWTFCCMRESYKMVGHDGGHVSASGNQRKQSSANLELP